MSTGQQDVISTLGLDGKRKSHPVRWSLLALAVAAGGYMFLSPPASDAETVAYVTQPVRNGELLVSVTATGTLQPTRQVDIGSEVSGIIVLLQGRSSHGSIRRRLKQDWHLPLHRWQ
jgi:HlyD family secretion protein